MKMGALSRIDVQVTQHHVIVEGNELTIPNITFIREMLPRGANGLVFQATDTILKRLVAVKVWIPMQGDRRDRTSPGLGRS